MCEILSGVDVSGPYIIIAICFLSSFTLEKAFFGGLYFFFLYTFFNCILLLAESLLSLLLILPILPIYDYFLLFMDKPLFELPLPLLGKLCGQEESAAFTLTMLDKSNFNIYSIGFFKLLTPPL